MAHDKCMIQSNCIRIAKSMIAIFVWVLASRNIGRLKHEKVAVLIQLRRYSLFSRIVFSSNALVLEKCPFGKLQIVHETRTRRNLFQTKLNL